MKLARRRRGLVAIGFAILISTGESAAQQAGQAIVTSGTSLVAIDLTSGGKTSIPIDDTSLNGLIDLTEEASGDLVLTDVSGVQRVEIPSGDVDLLTPPNGFGYSALATGPTGDLLATTVGAATGAATVAAIDPISGAAVEVVDAIPGSFVSQLAGVAADDANNLYLAYLTVSELVGGVPSFYSQIAKVPAGSTVPTTLVDSRDPGIPNDPSFQYLAFDGVDTLVTSTLFEEIYLVDASTGDAMELTDDGFLTDIQGLAFAPNGDVLAIDVNNGLVRITNPGGVQSVVPDSVVASPSGLIVYTPEPGLVGGLGLGALFVVSGGFRRVGVRASRRDPR